MEVIKLRTGEIHTIGDKQDFINLVEDKMGYAARDYLCRNEKQPLSVRVLQDELNCCEQEISEYENTIRELVFLLEEIKSSAFGRINKVKLLETVNKCLKLCNQ